MSRQQARGALGRAWWLQLALALLPLILVEFFLGELQPLPHGLAMPLFIAALLSMFVNLPLFGAYKRGLIATQKALDTAEEAAAWAVWRRCAARPVRRQPAGLDRRAGCVRRAQRRCADPARGHQPGAVLALPYSASTRLMRSFWLLACLLLSLSAGAAQRVVSLAPSLTDSVLELGAARRLVGVLDGGERPAAIGDLPSVGRYGQVNLERLLELQPDLILVWPGSVPEAQLQRLRDFGIALFIAEPHSLDELALQLAALGEALGEAEAGQRLSARFREGMRRLAERYRRDKPLKVFYQVWDRPLYTIGGRQVISDALRVCGAENLFGDLPQPAPQVSVEAVLARDPAVIVAGSHAQLELWRQWPALAATRRGQLYRIEDKNLERPSFAMLAATEKLCRSLAGAR